MHDLRLAVLRVRSTFRDSDGTLRMRVRVAIMLIMTAAYAAGIHPAVAILGDDAFDLLVFPVAAFAALGGTIPAVAAIFVGIVLTAQMESSHGMAYLAWVNVPHLLSLAGVAVGFILMRRFLLRSQATSRALSRSRATLHQVVASAPLIIDAYDLQGRFTLREGRALIDIGQTRGEKIGASAREHFVTTFPEAPQLTAYLDQALAGHEASGRVEMRGRVEETYFGPLRDASGAISGAVSVAVDVTRQRTFELELEHRALHDGLTDLPNRALLDDRVAHEIATCRRDGRTFALVLGDLNHLRDVNDAFGHAAGDDVLREVARRLRETVRDRDTVARFGGDEFALVLSGASQARAAEIVGRVLGALARPLALAGHPIDVSASFGISMFPVHGSDPETLLRHADIAMYAAKRTHRGFTLFAPQRDEPDRDAVSLVAGLRAAIEGGEIELAFQPEVRASDGALLRVEALARWERPGQGQVAPATFIPIAERAGMVGALTRQVIDHALHQVRRWKDAGLDTVVAVNVSAHDLSDPGLAATIAGSLRHWSLQPSSLAIEITESVLMTDLERTVPLLARLRGLGISVGIDDFGTGYSSLAYLSRLPVDRIKIDRSFVRGMATDPGSRAIARAAAELGHELGLHVVAEGVETATEWEQVRAIGCDSVQGYFVARPLGPEALGPWVAERNRLPRHVAPTDGFTSRSQAPVPSPA